MRRRQVLRAAAGASAAGALPLAGVGAGRAHPGPYEPFGSVNVEGAAEAVVGDDGSTVYVAATTGFAVVDVSAPSDPRVLADRRRILAPRDTGPLRRIHDVTVEGDTLLVVGPADPLGEDVLRGMAVYDVSDPANPDRTAFFETDYPIHNCFLRDGVAYLTGNDGADNPLVLVEVSGDEPAELGRWSVVDENPAWGDVEPWLRTCHDVWVQDDVAYVANWDAGTWLVDVSDPANPAAAAGFGDYEPADLAGVDSTDEARREGYQLPGNSHYAMPSEDGSVLAVGEEAWDQDPSDDLDGGPGGISLYDVADPADPVELARIDPPYTPDPSIEGVWTTAHNFDLVGDRLYTSWYRGGVKLFDVSDPANPEELAWWRNPAHAEFWTAKRAAGCFVASSRRDPGVDGRAALYAFPDHAGVQENPPSTPLTPTTTTAGTATTSTTRSTTTSTTATTTTTSTTTTENLDADPDETTTTSGQPGFGVGAALVGGALGAWRRLRRE